MALHNRPAIPRRKECQWFHRFNHVFPEVHNCGSSGKESCPLRERVYNSQNRHKIDLLANSRSTSWPSLSGHEMERWHICWCKVFIQPQISIQDFQCSGICPGMKILATLCRVWWAQDSKIIKVMVYNFKGNAWHSQGSLLWAGCISGPRGTSRAFYSHRVSRYNHWHISAGTAPIPADKLECLQLVIMEWKLKIHKKLQAKKRPSCTREELKSLLGIMNHACTIIPAGKAFLHHLYIQLDSHTTT